MIPEHIEYAWDPDIRVFTVPDGSQVDPDWANPPRYGTSRWAILTGGAQNGQYGQYGHLGPPVRTGPEYPMIVRGYGPFLSSNGHI